MYIQSALSYLHRPIRELSIAQYTREPVRPTKMLLKTINQVPALKLTSDLITNHGRDSESVRRHN